MPTQNDFNHSSNEKLRIASLSNAYLAEFICLSLAKQSRELRQSTVCRLQAQSLMRNDVTPTSLR